MCYKKFKCVCNHFVMTWYCVYVSHEIHRQFQWFHCFHFHTDSLNTPPLLQPLYFRAFIIVKRSETGAITRSWLTVRASVSQRFEILNAHQKYHICFLQLNKTPKKNKEKLLNISLPGHLICLTSLVNMRIQSYYST